MEMITVTRMKAQEFANLRKAAFNQFGSFEQFKNWMANRHFILEGDAYDTSIPGKEEKWSSGLKHERRE